jgi:hypothetical protein
MYTVSYYVDTVFPLTTNQKKISTETSWGYKNILCIIKLSPKIYNSLMTFSLNV